MSVFTWLGGSSDAPIKQLSAQVKELSSKVDELTHNRVVVRQDCESDSVQAQGLLDTFFFDKATIEQIKNLLAAVDPSKVKAVMDMIEGVKDGRLQIRIDLSIIQGDK